MMLAAPGQLVSVSHLATDPRSSAMAAEAAAYPATHARAEEIYLMDPELVLAGACTAKATVGMLTRMGIEVEVLQPPCAEPPPTDWRRAQGDADTVGRTRRPA
jgi:iron complex transport system substrate-binding protein